MTYHCQFRHLGYREDSLCAAPDTPPELRPVRNRSRMIIAYYCPVCLNRWDGAGMAIGSRDTALPRDPAPVRRAAMVKSLETP